MIYFRNPTFCRLPSSAVNATIVFFRRFSIFAAQCSTFRFYVSSSQRFIQVILVVQLISWTAQFIGHGIFERRAPALLDNILQAFLMAPFFVLFEALQIFFGYEPYPGFHAHVTVMIDAESEDLRNKKANLVP